jgi:HEAT repeat protein
MPSPRTLFAAAAVAVTAAAALFFVLRDSAPDPTPASKPTVVSTAEPAAATPGPDPAPEPARQTAPVEPPEPVAAPAAAAPPAAVGGPAAADVKTALGELRELFGPAGSLDYDAAKALIQQRKTRVEAIETRLGGMGADGARASLPAYRTAESMRERMALVHGLGRNPDPAATQTLTTLLAEEEGFSLRREIVVALGGSTAPGAEEGLAAALAIDDPRVRMAAVGGLAGRGDSLADLAALATSDPDQKVRLEAVRVIGVTGGDGALAALAGLTGADEQRLRIQVAHELARSFGPAAVPSLQSLLDDADVQVRSAVVQALGRIEADAARELLDRAASNDPSEAVRDEARRLLLASAAAP